MTSRVTKRSFALILMAALVALGAGGDRGAGGAGGTGAPEPSSTPATGHEHHTSPPTAAQTPAGASGTDATGAAAATGKGAPVKGQYQTITGEVMDPACFLEAGVKSIGPGHYQCAIDCARSGQTLAIYDRANDRIYFIAGELPGKNPNDPVMAFIHKKVDVTGAVYHRSGVYGIVINKVVLHQDKGPAPKP